jgi:hypothetical protein
MKKQLSFEQALIFGATLVIGLQAHAVDQAAAAADLAEIAMISVQSKANLAGDALGGNIDAVAESGKRSDAVDAAMSQGQESHSAMERAVAGGDDDAAQSAVEDLKASKQKALDALNGVIPESLAAKSVHDKWKESKKNSGGGPGNGYDAPNIYEKAWQTQGMRATYQGLWGSLISSGVTTGSAGDRDATPE